MEKLNSAWSWLPQDACPPKTVVFTFQGDHELANGPHMIEFMAPVLEAEDPERVVIELRRYTYTGGNEISVIFHPSFHGTDRMRPLCIIAQRPSLPRIQSLLEASNFSAALDVSIVENDELNNWNTGCRVARTTARLGSEEVECRSTISRS